MLSNFLRIVAVQARLPFSDNFGGNTVLQANTQNRPTYCQIFEQLGRHVALLAGVVPLQQQQHVGAPLEQYRLLVVHWVMKLHERFDSKARGLIMDGAKAFAIETDANLIRLKASLNQSPK